MDIAKQLQVVGSWVLDVFGITEVLDLPEDILEIVELLGIDNPLDPGSEIDFGVTGSEAGWTKRTFVKFDGGEKFNQKRTFDGFTKPFKNMSGGETKAYWWGHYESYLKGEEKKNDAYKRGFNAGARAQQTHEKNLESGITPAVRYTKK